MAEKATNIDAHERDLVVRLIQDDESAFCELYARYKNRLSYFALKYVKSAEFAKDVYQDAFSAIWQTRRFINPDTPFSTYLYTIVRNRILNLLRNMNTDIHFKEQILAQAVDYSDDTQAAIEGNDLRNIIAQAMFELTDRQREVFDMSRNQEMSHKEIAEQLNISVNTVQEHISAALKSLQGYLTQHYGAYSGLILILFLLE
ncbi:DNA-directed RNA polymerase sigma-70 factor [Bacteroidia bacterium]|nr:DNA-directed RNA polymerase sigma-70 factor [Bacteroidia bacterium]